MTVVLEVKSLKVKKKLEVYIPVSISNIESYFYDLNRAGIAELPNSLGEYAEYIFII